MRSLRSPLALAQERQVTEQIQVLARLARSEGDLVGEQFLAWFLKEQLEEMSSMADLLRTVERAATTNILLAESRPRAHGWRRAPRGRVRAASGGWQTLLSSPRAAPEGAHTSSPVELGAGDDGLRVPNATGDQD